MYVTGHSRRLHVDKRLHNNTLCHHSTVHNTTLHIRHPTTYRNTPPHHSIPHHRTPRYFPPRPTTPHHTLAGGASRVPASHVQRHLPRDVTARWGGLRHAGPDTYRQARPTAYWQGEVRAGPVIRICTHLSLFYSRLISYN